MNKGKNGFELDKWDFILSYAVVISLIMGIVVTSISL